MRRARWKKEKGAANRSIDDTLLRIAVRAGEKRACAACGG